LEFGKPEVQAAKNFVVNQGRERHEEHTGKDHGKHVAIAGEYLTCEA
jgi:hypothetical protein